MGLASASVSDMQFSLTLYEISNFLSVMQSLISAASSNPQFTATSIYEIIDTVRYVNAFISYPSNLVSVTCGTCYLKLLMTETIIEKKNVFFFTPLDTSIHLLVEIWFTYVVHGCGIVPVLSRIYCLGTILDLSNLTYSFPHLFLFKH